VSGRPRGSPGRPTVLGSRTFIAAVLALAAVVFILGYRPARVTRAGRSGFAAGSRGPVGTQTASARTSAERSRFPHLSPSRDPSRSAVLQLVDQICDALEARDAAWQDVVFSGLLPALVRADPRVAACLAENWDAGQVREGLLCEVGREWAATDPDGALTWAETLGNAGERNDVLGELCAQISQADPAEAVALAARLGIGQGNGTLEGAAQLWAGKDFASALDWALRQPQGDERDRLLSRVAYAEAQTSPASAASIVAESISPGPIQDEAVIAVVHQWGLRDSAAALGWVSGFPQRALRDRALGELAGMVSK
jgi:hypothetical protein